MHQKQPVRFREGTLSNLKNSLDVENLKMMMIYRSESNFVQPYFSVNVSEIPTAWRIRGGMSNNLERENSFKDEAAGTRWYKCRICLDLKPEPYNSQSNPHSADPH
ncbi:hypothetical protein BaRGS_00038627 [Batillaria attramentaria]|uniref:Uncharacterized protein n=1 Tax=Batillaria attramentaria TaxID=370345 RepID=A0ABD0J5Q3_9CAEN